MSTSAAKRTYGVAVRRAAETPRLSDYASPRLIQILERKMDNQLTAIQEMVQKPHKDVLRKLEKQFEDLRVQFGGLAERITVLEVAVAQVDQLKSKINQLENSLSLIEMTVAKHENSTVANELRIIGIPFAENENLNQFFKLICEAAELPMPQVIDIRRIKNQQLTRNNYNSRIVIKLTTSSERNAVLGAISNFRRRIKGPLTLKHIGFASDVPFYVNEQLTKTNSVILKTAVGYKKHKRIWSAYTHRGLVYIKQAQNDFATQIKSVSHLQQLIGDNIGFR